VKDIIFRVRNCDQSNVTLREGSIKIGLHESSG
jgi:hypothetical protein